MASFILRKVEDTLWARFKKRAEKDGHALRWVILALVAFYAKHGMPPDPTLKDR